MDRRLIPIFLIVVVDLLGLAVILPLLPFYAESLGASPFMVGVLLSTFAVCQLLAGPPLGQWSDRIGRKPVLLISQIGTLLGFLILGFARSLWMVFLGRILDGLTAGNLTVAQAYISDVTLPENRAKAFAVIGMAFGVGFLLGPALSGYLAQFGSSYPIFTAAGFSAVSIMATCFLLPGVATPLEIRDERSAGSKWRAYFEAFEEGPVARRLWQFFAMQFAVSTLFSGFALFAERRLTHGDVPFGVKEIGYVFAFLGLVGIAFQGAIGPLVKKFGEGPLVQTGFILMASSFALIAGVRDVLYLLAAMTLFAVGSSLLRPSLTSLISQEAPRHRQGMVIGLMQSLMSMAQIAAPLVAGALIERRFLQAWAVTGGLACGVGLSLSPAHRSGRRSSPVEGHEL